LAEKDRGEEKVVFISETNTTDAEGRGKRGFQGIYKSRVTLLKPFPDEAYRELCLAAEGQDFWTRQRVQQKPG